MMGPHACPASLGRRKAEAAKVLLFPRSKDRSIRQARVRIVVRSDWLPDLRLKTQGLFRDNLLFSSLYTRIIHTTAAATTTATAAEEEEEATTTLSVPHHVAIGYI